MVEGLMLLLVMALAYRLYWTLRGWASIGRAKGQEEDTVLELFLIIVVLFVLFLFCCSFSLSTMRDEISALKSWNVAA